MFKMLPLLASYVDTFQKVKNFKYEMPSSDLSGVFCLFFFPHELRIFQTNLKWVFVFPKQTAKSIICIGLVLMCIIHYCVLSRRQYSSDVLARVQTT